MGLKKYIIMTAPIYQYSVLPFSGPRYRENSSKLKDGDYGCAICGKSLPRPYKFEAVVVHGGDWASTKEEEENESDPGYMGSWGIGPDCHKKYLIKD